MSEHMSLRFPAPTTERLRVRARRVSLPPRTLAQRYVEEGLRQDEHPLVRFADGPAGRRARLVGGPDVWEVISVLRANENDVAETAAYLSLPVGSVQAAVAYYGAFPEEIDDFIAQNEAAWEEGHKAYIAGQRALGS